jgi:hypothetical protein
MRSLTSAMRDDASGTEFMSDTLLLSSTLLSSTLLD